MPITLTNTVVSFANVATHRMQVSISAGSDRVLVVGTHLRAPSGGATVGSVRLEPFGGGPTVATLDFVVGITASNTIQAGYFELRESELPPPGLYDLVVASSGATRMIIVSSQLEGVDQGLATLAAGHQFPHTPRDILLSTQIGFLSLPQDGCLLLDAVSAGGSFAVLPPAGLARDNYFPFVNSPLSTSDAYTTVDVADGPVDFGWSFPVDMNEIAMAYALYQPAGAVPAPPTQANANILGAVA